MIHGKTATNKHYLENADLLQGLHLSKWNNHTVKSLNLRVWIPTWGGAGPSCCLHSLSSPDLFCAFFHDKKWSRYNKYEDKMKAYISDARITNLCFPSRLWQLSTQRQKFALFSFLFFFFLLCIPGDNSVTRKNTENFKRTNKLI